MQLIIDIGNTLQKVAVFEEDRVVYFKTFDALELEDILHIEEKYAKLSHSISSSVADGFETIIQYLSEKYGHIQLIHNTPIPITNKYETPETLGLDRLAAVVGANAILPEKNILVIDAGTAITFDVVNNKGEYLGGTISPGIQMRFKALNNFTKKLPLCSLNEHSKKLGTDTNSSIECGVQNGILYEVKGYIKYLEKKYEDLSVFLTGGDTFFFDKKLKNTIFAEPLLVMKGLNRIILYNAGQIN